MALNKVDKETYDQVVSAVPEHPGKVRELRHAAGSIYYTRQYICDREGRLVAFHDDDDGGGQRWADITLLPGR